jgi:hypothetical protein
MATMTDEIMINASRDFVFNFVSDYANDVKWREGVIDMKCSTKANIFVGTRTKETMKFLGKSYNTIARVTEFTPFHIIAFRSVSGKLPVHGFRKVEDIAGYTRFIYSLTIEFKGLSKISSPVIVWFYKKRIKRDLLKLKSILESDYIRQLESFDEYKMPFGFYS